MSKMGGENKESIFELELNPKEDYAQAVRVLGVFLTGYPVNVNATLAAQKSRSFRLKWTTVEQMYEAKDNGINNAVIDRANGWILQIAEATGTHYTDSASVLKGSDGKLVSDYGNGDGIHLSAVGFNRVIDYLKTHAWL